MTKQTLASSTWLPSIIVGLLIAFVSVLSIWYLVQPQPLLVQGAVDATRFDIAAGVDGRVAEVPVVRGQDVAAGAVLVRNDNPETIAKNQQAVAAKIVAERGLPASRPARAWRPYAERDRVRSRAFGKPQHRSCHRNRLRHH